MCEYQMTSTPNISRDFKIWCFDCMSSQKMSQALRDSWGPTHSGCTWGHTVGRVWVLSLRNYCG